MINIEVIYLKDDPILDAGEEAWYKNGNKRKYSRGWIIMRTVLSNEIALHFSGAMRTLYEKEKTCCTKHPNANQTIVFTVHLYKVFKVSLTDSCCDLFRGVLWLPKDYAEFMDIESKFKKGRH